MNNYHLNLYKFKNDFDLEHFEYKNKKQFFGVEWR